MKRDGKQCNAVVTGGFSVCRLHGAGTRARPGGRPPVHGRYSKSIPQALRGKLEAAMNDPALLELRPEIGLIGVRIEELLEGLQEHSVNIKAAQKAFQKMRGAMADGDALEAQLQITALGSALDSAWNQYLTWSEVRSLSQERRLLVESERKRFVEEQQLMTSAQALALVNTLADIVYARVSNSLERAAV
ncbi:MAG: hypothetical protein HC933_18615, partial [Pleurocapsa sp. SU_196_0]|nr:hypothetical protein [Pleurocapsa sp. SU_196_0]